MIFLFYMRYWILHSPISGTCKGQSCSCLWVEPWCCRSSTEKYQGERRVWPLHHSSGRQSPSKVIFIFSLHPSFTVFVWFLFIKSVSQQVPMATDSSASPFQNCRNSWLAKETNGCHRYLKTELTLCFGGKNWTFCYVFYLCPAPVVRYCRPCEFGSHPELWGWLAHRLPSAEEKDGRHFPHSPERHLTFADRCS